MNWPSAALIASLIPLILPVSLSSQTVQPRVSDRVISKAVPFPLQDVRLLDGPFRDAMLRDQRFLLALDNDRLLHTFRITAGLHSDAKPLGGWEAPDVQLRGHSLGHVLSALSMMYASTGDERFKARADALVAELAKIQTALTEKGFHPGYLSAFPEEFFDRLDARKPVWAPYYTIHKTMAGLLDAFQYCNNPQALDVLERKAAWVKMRVERLSPQQQQAALQTEFGGMMEVLENLYALTGSRDYQEVARKFDHKRIFDPLARGEDPLNGLHANTQIPKAIGAARDYELSGEKRYRDIASFFWQRVAGQRSFVIGGNSDDEAFFPPETTSRHLGASSTETCNTYNMLKLTRHLFAWEPTVEKMDFYERGLYNHILASQDPVTGGFCYYVPLRPGAFKTFSRSDDSFWCCVGTGMENHAKYPDTIYFHDLNSVYVNLFIASELKWNSFTLRQETDFPERDTTLLRISTPKPVKLSLKIRYPLWAQSGITVLVNGKRQTVTEKPGTYVTLDRVWKSGDSVSIWLPMTLRFEAMPDDPNMIALLYGPIVLAGDLGNEGLLNALRYGPSEPQLGRVSPIEIPSFIGNTTDILTKVSPVPGRPLTFRTAGLARPVDVTLSPFYKVFDTRYTVYWKVYSPQQWTARGAEMAASESRRKLIERSTVDSVNISDAKDEAGHGLKGERLADGRFDEKRWRTARGGWLSYDLAVSPSKPMTIVCTFRGSEGPLRAFEIMVDGVKAAAQTLEIHPGKLFDFEYRLPQALTQGKQKVTVRFQSLPNAQLGELYDLRMSAIE